MLNRGGEHVPDQTSISMERAESSRVALSAAPASTAVPSADVEALLLGVLGPALGAALRLTANRQDAEDLVQEAALNAFRAFDSFQPGTNFKAWFFRILMNCFYTSHRRRRPETSMQDMEESHDWYLYERTREEGLHERSADPARLTISQMAGDDIARALEALPEDFRVVCTMYFMEDFSYQEIADMLSIPVGTVRSRLHRGRKILQKLLWELAVDQGIVAQRPAATTMRST
jgi:RNA polymerase sigma-70 factor (ECF subfamily)